MTILSLCPFRKKTKYTLNINTIIKNPIFISPVADFPFAISDANDRFPVDLVPIRVADPHHHSYKEKIQKKIIKIFILSLPGLLPMQESNRTAKPLFMCRNYLLLCYLSFLYFSSLVPSFFLLSFFLSLCSCQVVVIAVDWRKRCKFISSLDKGGRGG